MPRQDPPSIFAFTLAPRLTLGTALLLGLLLPAGVAAQETASADAAAAPTAPESAEVREHVRIDGVRTLVDYATLTRLLQGASGVRRVELRALDDSGADFELVVQGAAGAVAQALAGVAGLSAQGTGTPLSYRYAPTAP